MMLDILAARNAAGALDLSDTVDVMSISSSDGIESDVELMHECITIDDDDYASVTTTEGADVEGTQSGHPFGGLSWVDQRFDAPDARIGLHPWAA